MREPKFVASRGEIPDAIDVASNLGVHDGCTFRTIPVGENIEILNEPDAVVATVGIVREDQ